MGVIVMLLFLLLSALAILSIYGTNEVSEGYNTVQIQISYPGQWNGFYDSGDSVFSINGTGPASLPIHRPQDATVWTIIARVQKDDSTANILSIVLLANGQPLDRDYTDGPFAAALVSYTLGPFWCANPIPFYC